MSRFEQRVKSNEKFLKENRLLAGVVILGVEVLLIYTVALTYPGIISRRNAGYDGIALMLLALMILILRKIDPPKRKKKLTDKEYTRVARQGVIVVLIFSLLILIDLTIAFKR